jgi:ubiquinone/menaquinone biosynthesis C-methylase UbiE
VGGVSETAARFTAWAEVYREVWAPVLLPWNLRLLGELPPAGDGAVLDVGAGVGSLLPALGKRTGPGGRVVGVDRSLGMLRLAPVGSLVSVMDAEALALRDASFDAAVMPFVLFFVPEPVGALREAARVLRPGGGLGVAVWGPDRPYPAERIWTEELDRTGAAPAEPVPRTDEQMNEPGKLSGLLREAGFAEVRAVAEPFEWAVDADGFLRRYTGMGASALRYGSLSEEARRTLVGRVRERLGALDPEELVLRDEVVMAWGRRPG